MVVQAIIISLLVYLASMANVWYAAPMFDRPLIISTIVGLVLGDIRTGILCGVQLELAFIGVAQIGGTNPPDALVGSAVGTTFVILNGTDIEAAVALAVPIAAFFVFLRSMYNPLRVLFNPLGMRLIEKGEDDKFIIPLLLNSTLMSLPKALVVLLGVLASNSALIETVTASVPSTVISGLSAGSNMISAVGVAMLLKNMWAKDTVIYYFLGFILVTFANVSLLGVSLLGVCLAVILFMESKGRESVSVTEGGLFDD